ncbi:MAG: nuclear transport factor 2 family protein [Acidobacteriota bacterium]
MQAIEPSELYGLFSRYFSAGALDLLLTLYEDNAVILPAPGQIAEGKAAIREVLQGFLALNGGFQIDEPVVAQSGDVALIMSKWTLKGTSGDGEAVQIEGQTSDVVRRQADGSWLFVIDNPFGAQFLG